MRVKVIFAGILSAAVCFSMMTACGSSNNPAPTPSTASAQSTDNTSSTDSPSSTPTEESTQTSDTNENSQETPDKPDSVHLHKLYIRDTAKNAAMTATFLNTGNGQTEDVPMEKSSEGDGYITFSCEVDVNAYNMVHVSYGETTSMDVAFNECVGGWCLMNDALLPYAEGQEPVYDPQFDTKVFTFDGYNKTVYIWTPKDYDARSEDKYATIYMLDGQSVLAYGRERGMDNDFECWNVSENVTGMMSVTDNKAIIVAIETLGDPDNPEGNSRDDELVPDLGELATNPLGEQYASKKRGSAFADFICDTVMPYVQENYNVYTDRLHNAIVGSSLGGLESFYICLAHPDKFGTGGVMSASFWAYEEPEWNTFLSGLTLDENAPFLYIYAGGYMLDNGNVTKAMYDRLLPIYPKNKLVFSKYEPGEHFMAYWRNIFPEFLEAMFNQNVSALECGVPVDYIDTTDPYDVEISVDENDSRPPEVKNYVFYDNSETQWEKVYAYWWGGKTVNKVTKEPYGGEWPGVEMERIEGTDIYRVVAPLNATGFIFNSGVTDPEVAQGKIAYQTVDLSYNNAIAGMIYKIDLSVEPKAGRGAEKTKYRYSAGEWTSYEP